MKKILITAGEWVLVIMAVLVFVTVFKDSGFMNKYSVGVGMVFFQIATLACLMIKYLDKDCDAKISEVIE